MPELPEVHTTVQGLQILVNQGITKIKIYSTKLRYNIPKNIPKLLKNNKKKAFVEYFLATLLLMTAIMIVIEK